MRIGILVSLAVHGAAGAALALLAVARGPEGLDAPVILAVRAAAPSPEFPGPPEDPAIAEPPRVDEPWEFPAEEPGPEPVEAPLDEVAPPAPLATPRRIVRLPTPLPRRAREAAPAPLAVAPAPEAKGEIHPPRLRKDLSPEARYPARARRMGIEGTVVLLLSIAADGTVARVEVAASSGHADLDRAAADAATLWRFEPARRDGAALSYDVRVPVEFRLTDAS